MNAKILPATVLVALLAASGAVIATAQTAPADGATEAPAASTDAPAANAPAEAPTARGFFGFGGRGHDEGRGRGGLVRVVLAQADADSDGAVTQAEIDALRSTLVSGADASGEGDLSLDEFQSVYLQLIRPQVVDAFQDLDEDGDAVVTPAELDARLNGVVAAFDRDGDGALSPVDGGRDGGRGRDQDGRGGRD